MNLKQISVGNMANYSYLIFDEETTAAVIVDPAFDPQRILTELASVQSRCAAPPKPLIILTHHHFDHINCSNEIASETGAAIAAHPETADLVADTISVNIMFRDNDELPVGNGQIKVLHTPGHAPGSICLIVDNRWIVTGDTLFVGDCGRTDLSGSDPRVMFESLQRLRKLDDSLIVMPGHNYGASPSSTLGQEKTQNPALAARTWEEFCAVP